MPNNDRAQRRLDAKRAAKQDRHKLEALRREQAKRERRSFILRTGGVALVGLILVGAVLVPAWVKNANSPAHRALASIGASASAASCDAEITVAPEPGPATATTVDAKDRYHLQDTKPWTYQHNPPASGPHNPNPMPTDVHYYAPDAQTQEAFVEHLVHNLEHGFVVAWYDDTIAKDNAKLQALQDIGTNLDQKSADPYFIAAPWPTSRPPMPAGKHIALTTWHKQTLCGDVSGEAVQKVVAAHPAECAPENPTAKTAAQVKATCGTVATPLPTPSVSASVSSSVSGSPSPSPSGSVSTVSPSPSGSGSSKSASPSPSAT